MMNQGDSRALQEVTLKEMRKLCSEEDVTKNIGFNPMFDNCGTSSPTKESNSKRPRVHSQEIEMNYTFSSGNTPSKAHRDSSRNDQGASECQPRKSSRYVSVHDGNHKKKRQKNQLYQSLMNEQEYETALQMDQNYGKKNSYSNFRAFATKERINDQESPLRKPAAGSKIMNPFANNMESMVSEKFDQSDEED